MSGFDPRTFHMEFMVSKLTLGYVLFEYFGFPLSFHQCSVLCIHPLLTLCNLSNLGHHEKDTFTHFNIEIVPVFN
jgi:hypothetical protein